MIRCPIFCVRRGKPAVRYAPAALRLMGMALCLGVGPTAELRSETSSLPPLAVPVLRWTRIADCPADPLGREAAPGRGAYWAFDPGGARFYRYGGYTPTDCNALWTFDVGRRRWENPLPLDYRWPPPENRPGAGALWSMAYDSKRRLFWLSGGFGLARRSHPVLFDSLWTYDPATGAFASVSGNRPPGTFGPAVFDARNDLVVLAPTAADTNRPRPTVVHVYCPASNAWQSKAAETGPRLGDAPVWVYHPPAGIIVALACAEHDETAETWTYDAGAGRWERIETASAPPFRIFAGSAYVPDLNRIVVFGGAGGDARNVGDLGRGKGRRLDDTWTLDLENRVWKQLDVGRPELPDSPGATENRHLFGLALDYDSAHRLLALSAPEIGVWILRLAAAETEELVLPAAAAPPAPAVSPDPVFPRSKPSRKYSRIPDNMWVRLGGGLSLVGGSTPMVYDAATGFCLQYGGDNPCGALFSAAEGNALAAFDPATERWMALRWNDPCGPARPPNGSMRFAAFDPGRSATWFAGGRARRRLAWSLPPDTAPEGSTWRYDGRRDRFEFVPGAGPEPPPGLVCGFDPARDLFLAIPRAAWSSPHVHAFDPGKSRWDTVAEARAQGVETYAAFADSLQGLIVVQPDDEGRSRTQLFDAATRRWRDLRPTGEWMLRGPPALAYDSDNHIVLCLVAGETYAYSIAGNAWKPMRANRPGRSAGQLVYDSRHKVFLATGAGESMWAYRPGRALTQKAP